MIPRLKEQYNKTIVDEIKKKFLMKNKFMVPKFVKVVLNMGLGLDANDKKKLQKCVDDMALISGQKPIITKFRKSISNFKLREDLPIGVKVTLRGNIMYEFLDRLISVSLPRVRDFRGLNNKGFDGNGNYTLGVKEQIIFPEISIDKINKVTGMNITIVIDSNTDNESYELLKAFGMPFISKN